MGKTKTLTNPINWIIWTHAQVVADTLREPFLVLDNKFQVLMANKPFYRLFQMKPEETEGKTIDALGDGQWDTPKLKNALKGVLSKRTVIEGLEFTYDFSDVGPRAFLINTRAVQRENGLTPVILLAMEDVTAQKQAAVAPSSKTNKTGNASAEHTAELEAHIKELERLNEAMVGRELKMMELKKEIRELKRGRQGIRAH